MLFITHLVAVGVSSDVEDRTDDGYSYKKTLELYKEYKEKCTEDNFLYIKLLQYLLTYFIALKVAVGGKCEA